jgi:hypothetical protein
MPAIARLYVMTRPAIPGGSHSRPSAHIRDAAQATKAVAQSSRTAIHLRRQSDGKSRSITNCWYMNASNSSRETDALDAGS